MMRLRAEISCPAFPDGIVPHGYVDIQVQGDDQEAATEMLPGQIDRFCLLEDRLSDVTFFFQEPRENDFDNGDIYAVVVGGEGEALDNNPLGKIFYAY